MESCQYVDGCPGLERVSYILNEEVHRRQHDAGQQHVLTASVSVE